MTGFGSMQSAITLMTVSPDIRGKALGVIGVAIGTAPLGLLITGIVSGRFGIEVAITINCCVALFILIFALIFYRKELFLEDSDVVIMYNLKNLSKDITRDLDKFLKNGGGIIWFQADNNKNAFHSNFFSKFCTFVNLKNIKI